jgi:hypothetical protein
MKKILQFMSLIVLSAIVLSSCTIGGDLAEPTTTIDTTIPETTVPITTPTEKYTYPKEYLSGSIKLMEIDPYDSEMKLTKYRFAYYSFPGCYMDLVGQKASDQWYNAEVYDEAGEVKEMVILSFVKYFNISKEQFIKTTEEERQLSLSLGQDLSDEQNELFNPDIIYTFDNDIINNYYRRE